MPLWYHDQGHGSVFRLTKSHRRSTGTGIHYMADEYSYNSINIFFEDPSHVLLFNVHYTNASVMQSNAQKQSSNCFVVDVVSM